MATATNPETVSRNARVLVTEGASAAAIHRVEHADRSLTAEQRRDEHRSGHESRHVVDAAVEARVGSRVDDALGATRAQDVAGNPRSARKRAAFRASAWNASVAAM
jgi:hypothetical protein